MSFRIRHLAWLPAIALQALMAGPAQAACTTATGVSESILFDDSVFNLQFYKAAHADLRAAFANNDYGLAMHWKNHGVCEGRQAHPLFKAIDYLAGYSDLRTAYGADNYAQAINHYVTFVSKATNREPRSAIAPVMGSAAYNSAAASATAVKNALSLITTKTHANGYAVNVWLVPPTNAAPAACSSLFPSGPNTRPFVVVFNGATGYAPKVADDARYWNELRRLSNMLNAACVRQVMVETTDTLGYLAGLPANTNKDASGAAARFRQSAANLAATVNTLNAHPVLANARSWTFLGGSAGAIFGAKALDLNMFTKLPVRMHLGASPVGSILDACRYSGSRSLIDQLVGTPLAANAPTLFDVDCGTVMSASRASQDWRLFGSGSISTSVPARRINIYADVMDNIFWNEFTAQPSPLTPGGLPRGAANTTTSASGLVANANLYTQNFLDKAVLPCTNKSPTSLMTAAEANTGCLRMVSQTGVGHGAYYDPWAHRNVCMAAVRDTASGWPAYTTSILNQFSASLCIS